VNISRTFWVNGEWAINELGMELFVHVVPGIEGCGEALIMEHPGVMLIPANSNMGVTIMSMTVSQFL